jgi:hydroxymethylpyrimidine/phosphomethylpyrimidine kinase
MHKALTIAGSDSGGGAGIQADLKTFAALGVYGMSVLTAITAQNTLGVQGVHELPPEFVAQQIRSVLDDLGADAIKTGMLSSAPIIRAIAKTLRAYEVERLVIDPVMVARSGDPLLREDARDALISEMLPLATVLTPNRHEAQVLAGLAIHTLDDVRQAAIAIHQLGPGHVVVKGGDLEETDESVDVLYDGQEFHVFSAPRVETRNTHGTGCTFASAIAAELAKGKDIPTAVAAAKQYVTQALQGGAAFRLGQGHGPVHHFAPFYGAEGLP